MAPHVVALNISGAKGTRKESVPFVNAIEGFGLEGDAHGGPGHRQVSLLAAERANSMKRLGIDVVPGIFAENITTHGVDLATVRVGDVIEIGADARIEVTQLGKECHARCAVFEQAGTCIMPEHGVFGKVVSGGLLKIRDRVRVVKGAGARSGDGARATEAARPLVVRITGPSGSGKTTLIGLLIPYLGMHGFRVGTIKHASHALDVDQPGKDTYVHREAGAICTVGLGPGALFTVRAIHPEEADPGLHEIVSTHLADMDAVLVEGFKSAAGPEIRVLPEGASSAAPGSPPMVLGVIQGSRQPGRFVFDPEDVDRLADALIAMLPRPSRST